MSPLLEISGLHITRGRTAILDGVDWRVHRRENWVILGPNGSGKTSLLKALTGYLTPTQGGITLLGRRFGRSDWRDLRLQVGMVTNSFSTAIPPAEVALDTVVSGKFAQLDLWARVTPQDRRAGRRWLRFVGAEQLAKREWTFLSQGERQRVLIARALMARPRLLILDEPCAGLDPVARENFLQFIERLTHQRGAPALVLVTHHVEEITAGFSHVLLLRSGRVVASGPRPAVLTTRNLSTTFDTSLRLSSVQGRYRLAFIRP